MRFRARKSGLLLGVRKWRALVLAGGYVAATLNGRRFVDSEEGVEYGIATTEVGEVLVARRNGAIVSLLIGNDRAELIADFMRRVGRTDVVECPELEGLAADVVAGVGNVSSKQYPVAPAGTPFQERVWAALRATRPGHTVSYSGIARMLGVPHGARAVAAACAANPVAIMVPCHRAIRRDGTISGYRWGVERKRKLLEMERVGMTGDR